MAFLRTFALSPETLRIYLRRSYWRFQLIVTISFLLFGLYLAVFARPVRWAVVLPILVVIALVYFFVIFFQYRQQMRLLYSIRIELDGSGVIYRQHGQEPLRISRADITRASEQKDGLFIETVNPRLNMLVPNGLARNGDEEVRRDVSAWVRINERDDADQDRLFRARLAAYGVGFFVLVFVNQFWLAALFGLGLFIFGSLTENRLGRIRYEAPRRVNIFSSALTFIIFIILMKSCMLGLIWMMAW